MHIVDIETRENVVQKGYRMDTIGLKMSSGVIHKFNGKTFAFRHAWIVCHQRDGNAGKNSKSREQPMGLFHCFNRRIDSDSEIINY